MKKYLLCVLLVAALCTIVGCMSVVDPETGETLYNMTPAAAEKIDAVGGTVEAIGPAVTAGVGIINPAAGVIAGIVVTLLSTLYGCYKKWKQPLLATTDKLDKVSMGARIAASIIDEVVKPNKDAWAKAKEALQKGKAKGAINPDEL